MGYRIVYGADLSAHFPKKGHLRSWTAAFALTLVVLVRIFWPEGTQVLRRHLLPGGNAALSQLTEDIQAGDPIGDAVTAFCREVVREAVDKTD